MKRYFVLFVLIFSCLFSFAADNFTLKGSVRDRVTSSYILMAKIECLNSTDSVVGEAWAISHDYDYRRDVATEKAVFWMEIPRVKGKYTLRFTHEEFDTITAPLDLTNIGAREYDREIGTFYMDRPKVRQLKDLEVTASKIMFYNRGDTIVYNADAFELAEGSMLDVLIEQLPGVELRDGGQIYVNGKFVQSLLLNGKDFFKGDNKIMLDNLEAYTVKNIEVYKKQTERGRFLGLDDESNKELVMDVRLKKEYIGGWAINTEAAGGTEDRYLARLFAMNYRALSQITFIGNVNNLNDESRPTAEDQWDPDNMSDGDRRYQEAGFDYSVENESASRKASGDLVYHNYRNLKEYTTNTVNFLPGQNTYGNSYSLSLSRDFDIGTNHTLYMQTPSVAIKFRPNFSWSHGKDESNSQSVNANDPDLKSLVNSTLSEAFGGSDRITMGMDLRTTIKIPKTSDAVDVFGSFNYAAYKSHSESYNIVQYGDPNLMPNARRQYSDNDPTHNTTFSLGASYNLVFNSKLHASLTYRYSGERSRETSAYYLGILDAGYTGDYTLDNLYGIQMSFDPTNSNVSNEHINKHSIETHVSWQPHRDWEVYVNLPVTRFDNWLLYRQDGKEYAADYKSTCLDDTNVSLEYNKSSEESGYQGASFNYSRRVSLPSLENMITVPNTRDPLAQYLGNPDLKPAIYDQFSVILQKSSRSNFTGYIVQTYRTTKDNLSSGYIYDTVSGKRTYKTFNVNGDWSTNNYLYASWFWGRYNWSFSLSSNFSYYRSHSMVGSNDNPVQLVTMNNCTFSPRLAISKYFGSGRSKYVSLRIEPSLSHYTSTDINANNPSPKDVRYVLSGKYDLPYGWSLSTSFNLHTRKGYNDPQMDRNELIWNGRISKSFFKGRWMTSIVAYDLLHQHQATNYYITPQMRLEAFTNTIPRYVLFDLQYKINIQPKKKIAQTTHHY